MKKAEIKKIVLDLGDKEIKLNLSQTERLHGLLDKMFGKNTFIATYPIIYHEKRCYWDWPHYEYSTSSMYNIEYSSSNNTMTVVL